MPDAPDDFEYSNILQFQSIADNAELAARLNSAVIYEREGAVLYSNDFSSGLKGINAHDDDGNNYIELFVKSFSRSGLALKIYSEETEYQGHGFTLQVPLIEARYYILYIQFDWASSAGVTVILFNVGINNKIYLARVKFEANDKSIAVYNSDETYIDILDRFDHSQNVGTYGLMKLKIDTVTGYYVFLEHNTDQIDISDIEIKQQELYVVDQVQAGVYVHAKNAGNATVYIHNIVVSCSND